MPWNVKNAHKNNKKRRIGTNNSILFCVLFWWRRGESFLIFAPRVLLFCFAAQNPSVTGHFRWYNLLVRLLKMPPNFASQSSKVCVFVLRSTPVLCHTKQKSTHEGCFSLWWRRRRQNRTHHRVMKKRFYRNYPDVWLPGLPGWWRRSVAAHYHGKGHMDVLRIKGLKSGMLRKSIELK